jgi:DNA-binding Xre family transcriptional regulator
MLRHNVRCRLKALLAERRRPQKWLARRSREVGCPLSQTRITQLTTNTFKRISAEEISVLCQILGVGPAELFEVYENSVWFGAQQRKHLTIHVAMRSLPVAPGERAQVPLHRLMTSGWDVRALQLCIEHARSRGIYCSVELHAPREPFAPGARTILDLFPEGTHIVMGSPITSDFTERVVSLMHGVPPFEEARLESFRYGFVWSEAREVRSSSFAFRSSEHRTGIWCNRERRVVAERRDTAGGEGSDCGLIITYRSPEPGKMPREAGLRTERCVIVLAGHGAPGTLACTKLLCDRAHDFELYPPEERTAHMRAVKATVLKADDGTLDDNRDLTEQSLVEVRDGSV